MTRINSTMVGKFLINNVTNVLIHVDDVYRGDCGKTVLSVLDEGRRFLIFWEDEGDQWVEFIGCR